MIITEPMTALTDYAIALEALVFALSLYWIGRQRQHTSVQLWGVAFGMVAIAASLGGTCHGFVGFLGNTTIQILWRTMIYALSCASFFMLAATVISAIPRCLHRWVLLGVGVKSLIYLGWAAAQEKFGYIIADYLSAMVLVLLLQGISIYRRKTPSAGWIAAGILVSCVAVVVQASGVSLANLFNHNDLYHLVQMVALYLFYRGACLLKDS
jgi:hypothetical protein